MKLKEFADVKLNVAKTRVFTELDHTPPPGHGHIAGFGQRMENGLVRVD